MTQEPSTGRAVSPQRIGTSAAFLAIMATGYAVYAIDRTVLSSVLAPLSSSLSLTNSEIGLVSAAQYIGVTCIVFIAGYLSDRYGRWPVIISGVLVFTIFTFLIGFSTNFAEVFMLRLISGLGEGAFWPVAMASVANYFKGRKGLALGIFYVGFDAGSIAGLSIGGVAYSLSDSWRPAFFYAPLLGLAVMAATLLAWRRLPTAGAGSGGIRLGREALQLLRRRNVIVIMAFAFLATWASVWQTAFLPYYFFKVMHFTVLTSALLSSLVTAAGALGKVTIGGISDSVKRNRLLALSALATLAFYGLFFFASFNFALDLVWALSMGFFSASIFPVMQGLMTDTAGESTAGSALGLSTSTQSVATIFSTIIAASLFTLGVGRALALDAMIPMGLAFVLALFLRETRSAKA
ncbi:MAG: MFS transporter [Thaumarchaeota archaeon]|jgi:ACS family hexuronate transporter-like MFS transporter|nr:MFS transporter [Nitrososphaerota archaeon]